MKTNILYIFTRTPLHVGAGSSVGAVDSPVIRERHTGFPIIPGSSIKGVLRNHLQTLDTTIIKQEFGDIDCAGNLSFGEAKLLLFPLRSAKGSFALATCPLALSRYARDKNLAHRIPNVKDGECYSSEDLILSSQKVVLEEYCFSQQEPFPTDWATELSTASLDDAVLAAATERFILLSDGDFSHFAMNACQISQHNRIDDETGVAADGALFNIETVPSETLFYAPITTIKGENNTALAELKHDTLIQFGGKGTTGLGYSSIILK